MKRLSLTSLFLFVVIFSTIAQAPDKNSGGEAKLLGLIKEVQAQQTQITANQNKIDAKLTEATESVRIARIFSSRSR